MNLNAQPRRRSALGLIVIIALGIILGQIGYQALKHYVLIPRLPTIFAAESAPPIGLSEAERARWLKRRDSRDSARRSASANCEFWQQQLTRDPTEYNKTMRDAACSRGRGL